MSARWSGELASSQTSLSSLSSLSHVRQRLMYLSLSTVNSTYQESSETKDAVLSKSRLHRLWKQQPAAHRPDADVGVGVQGVVPGTCLPATCSHNVEDRGAAPHYVPLAPTAGHQGLGRVHTPVMRACSGACQGAHRKGLAPAGPRCKPHHCVLCNPSHPERPQRPASR